MKKRRPPRPRKRKAPVAVEAKRKVEALSSSVKVLQKHDATVRRPAAIAKTIELADRIDTVGGMSNARGWKIFAGIIVSFLLVSSAVVLFATHWT